MKKKVIQVHHISYEPEETVVLTKGEHWVITQLNRFKCPSKGLIKALKVYVALNEDRSIDPCHSKEAKKKSRKK